MNWSLNETQALCRKAARGAGMAWGLADDAGFAARWLEDRGQGGAAQLAALLPDWATRAEAGTCPIRRGTAWADLGQAPTDLSDPEPLLWPFLALVAAVTNVAVTWGAGNAISPDGGLTLSGKTQAVRGRAAPDAATIATLETFAARTYAPATEASRLAGAGAGTSDND